MSKTKGTALQMKLPLVNLADRNRYRREKSWDLVRKDGDRWVTIKRAYWDIRNQYLFYDE